MPSKKSLTTGFVKTYWNDKLFEKLIYGEKNKMGHIDELDDKLLVDTILDGEMDLEDLFRYFKTNMAALNINVKELQEKVKSLEADIASIRNTSWLG